MQENRTLSLSRYLCFTLIYPQLGWRPSKCFRVSIANLVENQSALAEFVPYSQNNLFRWEGHKFLLLVKFKYGVLINCMLAVARHIAFSSHRLINPFNLEFLLHMIPYSMVAVKCIITEGILQHAGATFEPFFRWIWSRYQRAQEWNWYTCDKEIHERTNMTNIAIHSYSPNV